MCDLNTDEIFTVLLRVHVIFLVLLRYHFNRKCAYNAINYLLNFYENHK